ncbi:uncharacterized protein LOC122368706 [Amphibalanus amphitrite]|nr:uncharacterized protein LOC122368706 [Amphibalanus amphitrite]
MVKASCQLIDGRYEIALPFRDPSLKLPNNKSVAYRRLVQLKRRFENQPHFLREYAKQIDKLLDNGYAERAPDLSSNAEGRIWFVPHHGVEHPVKKGKLRVVFDCASSFQGKSLNEELLQGPDLTNTLTDVLLRFRQEPVAFMADVEGMFLQVRIPEKQRDFLRFLWWPNGNIASNPKEYRMTVHLFGAVSSPSCANFALRRTALDNERLYDPLVSRTVLNNFYVDDCLASTGKEDVAVKLASDLKQLCLRGGFNLTKFVSNSVTVLKSIPEVDYSPGIQTLDLKSDTLPSERALGVGWNVRSDRLEYQVDLQKFRGKPVTRRGLLSATAGLYDPLGHVGPYVMRARMLLQELTRLRLGWDDEVPSHYHRQWKQWLADLECLSQYSLPRCICFGGLSSAVLLELHHFSDASERGYGVASYVRAVNGDGQLSCNLLVSKSHLAPIKPLSIPRLELSAATLAVKVNLEIQRAFPFDFKPDIFFWTDSTTVLKYIQNEAARFHVFVANRLAVIRDGSSIDQWRWVPSELNPADILSRGCDGTTLLKECMWRQGPSFLLESREKWPRFPVLEDNAEDPELRVTTVALNSRTENETKIQKNSSIQKLIDHYSSWQRLKRAVAWVRRVIDTLAGKQKSARASELTVTELKSAENIIIRELQGQYYAEEVENLKAGREVRRSSSLVSLDPTLEDGLLRVGGRLGHAMGVAYESKHPLIIPNKGRIPELIIRDIHERIGHAGRQCVLAELRKSFWLIKANTAVRRCLHQCLRCRRLFRTTETQKMADLPADRIQQSEQPWVSTGVDYFGPFYTKRGRGQVKRYGVIFTCLAIRAVHLEVVEILSSDSFICALKRFAARRGSQIRIMRSDNGTNFVGADRELKKELEFLVQHEAQIRRDLINRGIEWRWNPPGASHFGGAWERLIRSVRKILSGLLREQTFTDETLTTFLCEVESIMNNRPLVPVTSDPRDDLPLTPNHLLHLRSVLLPASMVTDIDAFSKKNWKRASFLAEQFWRRWRAEYLPLLQPRAKWSRLQTNLQVGDVVLIVDSSVPRGVWPLGLIEEVRTSTDSRVRSVKIRCKGTTIWRPVQKLVKITES